MIDDVIAECRLLARDRAGVETPVTIQIGRPVQHAEHAECPVFVNGLDDQVRKIYGEDTLQALVLAIRFARSLVEIRQEQGLQICDSEGDPVDWEGYPIPRYSDDVSETAGE